jgi:hypothetical protein
VRRLQVQVDVEAGIRRGGWTPAAGDRLADFEITASEVGVSGRGPARRVTLETHLDTGRPGGADDLVEIQQALGPIFDEAEARGWRINGTSIALEPAS